MISHHSCVRSLFAVSFREECQAMMKKAYNLFSIFRPVSIQLWEHPSVAHHHEAPCKTQHFYSTPNQWKIKKRQQIWEPVQGIILLLYLRTLFQCERGDFYIRENMR